MSDTPPSETRILDYAPPQRWGWRDGMRLLARLTPVCCLLIVGLDYAIDLRPERLPWRAAQGLCALIGIICLMRREYGILGVCFLTLLLLILLQPSFDRAT